MSEQRLGDLASLEDMPLVVTLDQLRPYEHNPRVTRNPRYDEIKASIRERGLDSPPAITRRPGEAEYIIRSGGNTRLAILRELWAETREERFLRIPCLFRPWTERGEIVALTGHLAENELRGNLTFIERALGIEKACELYAAETGRALSQSELSRRLSADGYPVPQPHISRMREAITYLLPAIPSLLYGGLGRPQIERLTGLRRAAQRLWDRRAVSRRPAADFTEVFQDVLSQFDGAAESFSLHRFQDELLGQLAVWLDADYDTLALELEEGEAWQQALLQPADESATPSVAAPLPEAVSTPPPRRVTESIAPDDTPATAAVAPPAQQDQDPGAEAHTATADFGTERLRAIQQLAAAAHLGEASTERPAEPDQATAQECPQIPDVWFIEATLDRPQALRVQIAQLARDVAAELGAGSLIDPVEEGIGYRCQSPCTHEPEARPLLDLLRALSRVDRQQDPLVALLLGEDDASPKARLSDDGLLRLFRLLRLARRLRELAGFDSATPRER